MLGTSGIVAPCIALAAGAAYTYNLLQKDQVSVAFFSDGAVNNGSFHEGINMAAAWQLPAIFVCENNLYATEVPFATVTKNPSVAFQILSGIRAESLDKITTEKVLPFLNQITEGRKQQTKRTRYSHLLSFFNFIKYNLDQDFRNPCDTPMLKKLFRARPVFHWNIIEKETVDEVIFRTSNIRNQLILELMARGGMRIGEVLKLTPSDIHDRRLTLRDPKSGREQEFVFIPQRLADRLKDYIREKGIQPHQPIFPICYEAARAMVAKAGSKVGIHLRPHDLRRHAATYASRSGVPIEIISIMFPSSLCSLVVFFPVKKHHFLIYR